MIHTGDCVEVMAGMEAASVDAIVTDPPYEIGFMSKAWDQRGIAFDPATWRQMLRVAKPGAYLLAFGGTRTYHRMTCAIEDAGWIIRDCLVWGYASGFPKGKANLKPAWEPIVMARKPGPLRPLAIDECRIGWASPFDAAAAAAAATGYADLRARGTNQPSHSIGKESRDGTNRYEPDKLAGRWPANVILTDPIFDGDTPGVVGGGWQESTSAVGAWKPRGAFPIDNPEPVVYGDSGTYSRFFLIPKADRAEREPILGKSTIPRRNTHPTVKPLDLMRHLVRLVTPAGGIVLDPFLGSGTTALAAEMEGFPWVGIEREPEYVAIAEARLNGTQRGLGLQLEIG